MPGVSFYETRTDRMQTSGVRIRSFDPGFYDPDPVDLHLHRVAVLHGRLVYFGKQA